MSGVQTLVQAGGEGDDQPTIQAEDQSAESSAANNTLVIEAGAALEHHNDNNNNNNENNNEQKKTNLGEGDDQPTFQPEIQSAEWTTANNTLVIEAGAALKRHNDNNNKQKKNKNPGKKCRQTRKKKSAEPEKRPRDADPAPDSSESQSDQNDDSFQLIAGTYFSSCLRVMPSSFLSSFDEAAIAGRIVSNMLRDDVKLLEVMKDMQKDGHSPHSTTFGVYALKAKDELEQQVIQDRTLANLASKVRTMNFHDIENAMPGLLPRGLAEISHTNFNERFAALFGGGTTTENVHERARKAFDAHPSDGKGTLSSSGDDLPKLQDLVLFAFFATTHLVPVRVPTMGLKFDELAQLLKHTSAIPDWFSDQTLTGCKCFFNYENTDWSKFFRDFRNAAAVLHFNHEVQPRMAGYTILSLLRMLPEKLLLSPPRTAGELFQIWSLLQKNALGEYLVVSVLKKFFAVFDLKHNPNLQNYCATDLASAALAINGLKISPAEIVLLHDIPKVGDPDPVKRFQLMAPESSPKPLAVLLQGAHNCVRTSQAIHRLTNTTARQLANGSQTVISFNTTKMSYVLVVPPVLGVSEGAYQQLYQKVGPDVTVKLSSVDTAILPRLLDQKNKKRSSIFMGVVLPKKYINDFTADNLPKCEQIKRAVWKQLCDGHEILSTMMPASFVSVWKDKTFGRGWLQDSITLAGETQLSVVVPFRLDGSEAQLAQFNIADLTDWINEKFSAGLAWTTTDIDLTGANKCTVSVSFDNFKALIEAAKLLHAKTIFTMALTSSFKKFSYASVILVTSTAITSADLFILRGIPKPTGRMKPNHVFTALQVPNANVQRGDGDEMPNPQHQRDYNITALESAKQAVSKGYDLPAEHADHAHECAVLLIESTEAYKKTFDEPIVQEAWERVADIRQIAHSSKHDYHHVQWLWIKNKNHIEILGKMNEYTTEDDMPGDPEHPYCFIPHRELATG